MSVWLVKVQVTLKPVVNDPEGLSIARALHQLGFGGVESVRAGKYFEIEITADDRAAAEREAHGMCRRLLTNPVVEDYRFTLARAARSGARRSPG